MIIEYFTITSNIRGVIKTEGFYLSDEIDEAMNDLDKITIKHLGADHFPLEDGQIGFEAFSGDYVYLEEKSLIGT